MRFQRTDEYQQKLFEQALFDEKNVIQDARITIEHEMKGSGKLKAYCHDSGTYLQFPRSLRQYGLEYVADVVEVIRTDGVTKYYRAMPKSIRHAGSDVVVG